MTTEFDRYPDRNAGRFIGVKRVRTTRRSAGGC